MECNDKENVSMSDDLKEEQENIKGENDNFNLQMHEVLQRGKNLDEEISSNRVGPLVAKAKKLSNNGFTDNITKEAIVKASSLLGAQCIMPGYDKELLEKLKNRRV
ncbi:conserved Plasmodium protein, unknown function [Plasmodium malariae]|uniref:Uncharacterized protein n=1 Tax=Plasmodium malariae TaxID=5858 RepID=A0A1C3KE58_PLAMA|nr:conserved Plasmodium protein, unknown function [Plasmodium malariae]